MYHSDVENAMSMDTSSENSPSMPPRNLVEEENTKNGFTQVQNLKNKMQRKPTVKNSRKHPNTNSFEDLTKLPQEEEVENPHKTTGADGTNNK
jgi:hypothetical protein